MISPMLVDALKHVSDEFAQREKGSAMKTEIGKAAADCCDAKVVKVDGDKLTSTSEKGVDHQYTVAKDAKVTCDGKDSKLSELKAGSTIRMTMCKDDKNKVLAVDCGKHIPTLVQA
jgi:hypothetical protein